MGSTSVIDATSIDRRGHGPSLSAGLPGLKALDRGRVAVGMTAIAVAMLPAIVPRGPANVGPVDLLLAIALVGCLVWGATTGHRWRLPYVVPIGLMLAGGALGALAGPVPATGIVTIIQELSLVAWGWALVNIGSSPGRLTILLRTWAYSSIAWVLVLFAALFTGTTSLTGQTASEGSRTALTFADPNVAANYFFVSMMIIWSTQCPQRRAGRFAAYALLLAAILSTGSNSGIVSLTVGVLAAALVGVYRRLGPVPALTALAFVLLTGFLATSMVSVSDIQSRAHESRYAFVRDGIGRGASSVEHRDKLLQESLSLYETGGLLGQGPASTKPRLEKEMAPLVKEAHNDYFAALTERGILGLLGLLLLVLGLVVRTASLMTPSSARRLVEVLPRPNALVGAVVGTMVAMTVYELLHVRHVWTLFAFVAALHLWSREWHRSAGS